MASIWTSFCCCESALSFSGAFAVFFEFSSFEMTSKLSLQIRQNNIFSALLGRSQVTTITDCTQIILRLATIGVWVFYTSDTMREGFQGLQWSQRWSSNEGFQSEAQFWQTLPTSPNLEVYISSAYSICLVDHEKSCQWLSPTSTLPTHIY